MVTNESNQRLCHLAQHPMLVSCTGSPMHVEGARINNQINPVQVTHKGAMHGRQPIRFCWQLSTPCSEFRQPLAEAQQHSRI